VRPPAREARREPDVSAERNRPVLSRKLIQVIASSGLIDPDPNHIYHVGIEMDLADVAKIHVTYVVDSRILSLVQEEVEKS